MHANLCSNFIVSANLTKSYTKVTCKWTPKPMKLAHIYIYIMCVKFCSNSSMIRELHPKPN